jgi:hypothetical protein
MTIAAAVLLAIAGALKLFGPTSDSVTDASFIAHYAGRASGAVDLTLAVGVVMLRRDPLLRPVLCVIFSFFAGVAFYRWHTGYESCGCFGAFRVDPSITAMVDSILAVAFAVKSRRYTPRIPFLAVVAAAHGLLLGMADVRLAPACFVQGSDLVGSRLMSTELPDTLIVYNPHCPSCEYLSRLHPEPQRKVISVDLVRAIGNRLYVDGDADGCNLAPDHPLVFTITNGRVSGVRPVIAGEFPSDK